MPKVKKIKVDNVLCSYSGKPGCMCGCLGNYRYRELLRDEAGADRGYEVDDDEISDRAVGMQVKRFNSKLDQVKWGRGYAYIETETRNNAIYFHTSKKAK